MAEALLSLQDIRVNYGDATILRLAALSVYSGEVLALIGPNGAGKSTLLRVMALLQRPTEGRVYFHGREVSPNDGFSIRRRMAMVFQEPLLLDLSVYENVTLGLKLRGLDKRSTEQRVRPWLKQLGIEHLAQRHARGLSGGEAQRVSLARALVLEPEILLLDEPFSALDPITREDFLIEFESMMRETAITTVFVTHDRNEAFMLAHRVAVLMNGRLLQAGPKAEVFTRPVNKQVGNIVGIDTMIPAVVETVNDEFAQVRFDDGIAAVPGHLQPGERVLLCLRPEDIALARPDQGNFKSGGENHFLARVLKIIAWGSYYRIVLGCGGSRLVALVTRASMVELGLQEGNPVLGSFKTTAVHVIKQQ